MFDVSYPPQDESNELTCSASADFKPIRMKRFLELEGDIERTSGPDSLVVLLTGNYDLLLSHLHCNIINKISIYGTALF